MMGGPQQTREMFATANNFLAPVLDRGMDVQMSISKTQVLTVFQRKYKKAKGNHYCKY